MEKKDPFAIYNALRQFHKQVFDMLDQDLTNWQKNAIETLSGVLYLVEGVFSKEE